MPHNFTTQSLGELRKAQCGSYQPINENHTRFRFVPTLGNTANWSTLIDQRVPQLNKNWRTILAKNSAKVAAALAEQGLSYEDSASRMKLTHLTLHGNGKAHFQIALSASEEGYFLLASIDENDRLLDATVNR